MEFLEALSPTLLVLVIIKHFTVKFITKNKFQMPEKKEIVYEKHIKFFLSMLCMHFAYFLSDYPHVLNLFK